MRSFEHFDRHSLVKLAKEVLELGDTFDYIPNRRDALKKYPFEYYCLTCVKPTQYITNFEYVTDECMNIFCTNDFPCVQCIGLIERLKFFMRVIKIIDHDPVRGPGRGDRVREYVRGRNLAWKRSNRSLRRRQRIKDQWRDK